MPAYTPEYPEELQEQDAINELFAGFDYDDGGDEFGDNSAKSEVMTSEIQSFNGATLPDEGLNLKDHLADLEVSLIKQALSKHHYVVARAAETLAMRRTTLVEKMRKYDLQKPCD